MRDRDQLIYEEAAALWRELFHEPPPKRADGPGILEIIINRVGEGSYDHINSPFLRPSTIVGPKRNDSHPS